MEMKACGNTLASGGRVSLNRDVLMKLRREKGLSQELVALMCAEQRLCVSIASIKRAETGKNILYRTARDISIFFDVDLTDIVGNDPTQDEISLPLSQQSSQIEIPAKRQIVLLVADIIINNKDTISGIIQYWCSACESAARQYDGKLYQLSETRSAFLFGSLTFMGYEHFQAIHCAISLQNQMQTILDHNGVIHSLINYQQIILEHENILPGKEYVKSISKLMAVDDNGYNSVDRNLILVSESIKKDLKSRFPLTPINESNDLSEEPIWQVNSDKFEPTKVKSFIGRELQRQQFKSAVESVFAYSEMQVIYIRGTAGIGKTRLLEEFSEYANSLGINSHKAHVVDFGTEQNQLAIPKLIRSILKLSADDRNLDYEVLNTRFGGPVCEERDLMFLYSWLNWSLSRKDLSIFKAMNHEMRTSGLQRVVDNLIRYSTEKAPLLLCIEDLHWANNNLLESIQHFAEVLRDTQVILILTSRVENDPLQKKWSTTWVNLPMMVMSLSPLRTSEAQQFADYFEDISDEHKKHCIKRAEGNPLFLEQLLCEKKLQFESLPHTVQTLVQVKLDSLSTQCRAAVRTASVIGQWFTAAALNYILQTDEFNIDPLIEHYLVKRTGDRYQFVHALVHQGIYQTITEEARAKLHQRCAQWFEPFDIALQARHLNRAKITKSADIYLQAVDKKMQENNFDEANVLADEALLIDYANIDEAAIWLKKGEIMVAIGNTELAIDCYQKAISLASTKNKKFAPFIGLANCLDTLERHDEALAALSQAEECLSAKNINLELSQLHYLRGNFYFPKGQVTACMQEHSKALDYARMAKDSNAEAKALGGLGDAAYAQGKMITAYNYFKQCLTLCASHDFSKVEAANRFMIGTTRIYLNETEQALEDALDSAELAESIGHKRAEIVSRLTAAWILLDQQSLEAAKQQCDQGMALADEIGAQRFKPFLAESIARYHYYMGDKDVAKSVILEAYNNLNEHGVKEFIGPWVISSYALVTESIDEANTLLEEGHDLLMQHCIGHNYYRYYVNAIEVSLMYRNWTALEKYIHEFKTYTHDEPTPWSDFYLNRAELIAQAWQAEPSNKLLSKLASIKNQANQVQLNHSIKFIEQAIQHLKPNE